jgi:hypothetical protein
MQSWIKWITPAPWTTWITWVACMTVAQQRPVTTDMWLPGGHALPASRRTHRHDGGAASRIVCTGDARDGNARLLRRYSRAFSTLAQHNLDASSPSTVLCATSRTAPTTARMGSLLPARRPLVRTASMSWPGPLSRSGHGRCPHSPYRRPSLASASAISLGPASHGHLHTKHYKRSLAASGRPCPRLWLALGHGCRVHKSRLTGHGEASPGPEWAS